MAKMKFSPYWEERRNLADGRKKKFRNPQQLWTAAIEYFNWVEQTPMRAAELLKWQGEHKVVFVPRMRAMSIAGLSEYLQISKRTFENYCSGGEAWEEYYEVAQRIQEVIRTQKFEGAAADMLNASIICRDLGLVDKQQVTDADGRSPYRQEVHFHVHDPKNEKDNK